MDLNGREDALVLQPVYLGLRNQILQLVPQEVGISPGQALPTVWGGLMEMRYPQAVVTLALLADGTTSLYFSNGGGMLGGGQILPVAHASQAWIAAAEMQYANMPQTQAFPVPLPGKVRFYILAYAGIYTAEGDEEELATGRHDLSGLFFAGQEVISRFRISQQEGQMAAPQTLDELIRLSAAPLLKSVGFRKVAHTFQRQVGEIWQVVNFQASQGNIGLRRKFTLNFGLYHPAIARLAGVAPCPDGPKEEQCQVRTRIGGLQRVKRDWWWDVGQKSVGYEVVWALEECGLPWLEGHSNLSSMAEALREQPSILAAAAALAAGEQAEARRRLAQMIANRPLAAQAARQWAQQQGWEGFDAPVV